MLFVVDRKDLDYQTMREYDRFEKGAANSNTSTAVLKQQLEDPSAKIIITTIQKLATFIGGNKGHAIYDGHVVIIFDECHRSQFGDMHTAITKAFKRYHLFGFTGTPIFAVNAGSGGNPNLRTTEQAFGCSSRRPGQLPARREHQMAIHTYTIVDAINDKNVLPFRIDYVNTIKLPRRRDRQAGSAIDTERALLAPERLRQVVGYILEHFDQKTKRARALLARRASVSTASTPCSPPPRSRPPSATTPSSRSSRTDLTPDQRLKVGMIYSYAANEDSRRRLPRRGGLRDQLASTSRRVTSSMPRSRTTTPCSARASTPQPTSSRTTTRTCRSD